MKPRVLMIVTGDPRLSSRPAEAVRIAAGVGTWQKVEMAVYLRGEAIRTLLEEGCAPYWELLTESKQAVYAQANAPGLGELNNAGVKFQEISDDILSELAATQTYVVRF